jgi:hypothetical protein
MGPSLRVLLLGREEGDVFAALGRGRTEAGAFQRWRAAAWWIGAGPVAAGQGSGR